MDNLAENSAKKGGTDLETLDYLRGVKSSTCLLLPMTPSPTQLDFKHPLSEEMTEGAFLTLNDDSKIVDLQCSPDPCSGDSSSSADSNSVVQDPVSAQLINNISMLDYQTLSKNGDIIGQPEICKLNGSLNVSNRKLPHFVNWNWCIIRKVLLWFVVSGLVACTGTIIAMVINIPKECNPDLPWYQGKVFYEIFPASFKDSNNDGMGDLKGLIKKLDYIKDLGGSSIRLNYIFEAQNYPENYYNTTSLLQIDRSLGVLKDFQELVTEAHKRNMGVILDIPVLSMAETLNKYDENDTFVFSIDPQESNFDATSAAIAYWSRAQNVDGFYLKNLEKFVDDVNFGKSLQVWKQILGYGKIFIASEEALNMAKDTSLTVLLSRIDLIDVHLDLQKGIDGLKKHIEGLVPGILWDKPHYPWIQWNIGNVNSERISSKHQNNTLVLTALELVLPGTVSIFYGDEVSLGGLSENEMEGDFHEHEHIHNLIPMSFNGEDKVDNNSPASILPWNSKSVLEPQYQNLNVVRSLIRLRSTTPTIYLKSIYKEGRIQRSMEIRETEGNLIVIERWFPRRNTCVFVGNLGNKPITTDLSSMFYGGIVIGSTNMSLVGEAVYLEKVTFEPFSAIILKLEK
ncbi:amino acid transporter heavy chain SLC3A2-like [Danaus plexippus]|uniref:amino acid transporter heavy chain SLC3A2-like n=1 Tax=Danaus plexippus TaxID=13037 RepID=UPI002AAF2102|nr:amino acid transporter heavy chain SLC3A2-like [Danaus plexippus]